MNLKVHRYSSDSLGFDFLSRVDFLLHCLAYNQYFVKNVTKKGQIYILAQFCLENEKFIRLKKLGYPLFLVLVSLTTAVCITAVTAVTLASYSKVEKHEVKAQENEEGSTVVR